MRTWLLRKEGKTCPVCRVAINPNEMQRFKIGQRPMDPSDAPARVVNNEPAPKSKRHIEYNLISPGAFKSSESMECNGSYGSKIQTLIRHLLYLQIIEPGAKSIIFSAWADSLFSEFTVVLIEVYTYLLGSYRTCSSSELFVTILLKHSINVTDPE